MMAALHSNGTNLFSLKELSLYSHYLTTGLYQLGSSLPFAQRMFLFPYFTTYFYFFVIITSTYEILNKFLAKLWKKNTTLICLSIIFLFVYWYLNSQTYVVLVGNIESSFLLILILLPCFLHFNENSSRYFFIILLIGYLFYNETCILVEIFYLLAYLIFLFIFRKKYNVKIGYFFIITFLFILSVYLIIYFAFSISVFFNEHCKVVFLILSLIDYSLFISLMVYFSYLY